jgi:hypothetical protein
MAIRTAIGAVSGSLGGALTAGTIKIITNVLEKGKIQEGDLVFIESPLKKHEVWTYLIENGYISEGKTTDLVDSLTDIFPGDRSPTIMQYEVQIIQILKSVNSIWKEVGSAVTIGASVGGVAGGVGAFAACKLEQN